MGAGMLSPEDLAALAQLPGLDAEQADLRRQLEAAQMLRGTPAQRHTSGLGALFGGLGTVMGDAGGALKRRDLEVKMGELLKRRMAPDAAVARVKGLQMQQGLEKGGLDMEATRQRMAAEAAAEAERAAERASLSDPASARSTLGSQLLGRLGMKTPEGAAGRDVEPLLPLVGRVADSESRSKDRALTRQLARQRETAADDALSPGALDMLAEQFATTGRLPALGTGRQAAELRMRIATRAQELHPDINLAGAAASYGADSGSLKKLQTQADAINAFERTALANLDTFLESARQIADVGSPLFNAPARKFDQQVAGNPAMARYSAARQVAVQEISKVLSGQMGNAAVSDSARHEAASLLSPDASLAQIKAAAEVLRRDMENRKAAMEAELGAVRSRAGGGGVETPASAPAGGMVEVVSPTGQRGRIPAANLEKALAKGYQRVGP